MNTITETSNLRYRYIDLMKFIAIFLVIFYHFTTFDCDFVKNPTAIVYINYTLRTICSMCVPLFFFVNGFLLIRKELDIYKHIKKIIKLVILAFVWSIIEVLLISNISCKPLTLYDFFLEIWTRKSGMVGHLWYIGALVCVWLFFPLIKTCYDNNKKVFNYFIAVCTVLVFGNQLLSMIARMGYWFAFGGVDKRIVDNVLNMYNPFLGDNSHAFGYFCVGCFVGGYKQEFDEYLDKHFNKFSSALVILISTVLLSVWGIFCSLTEGKVYDIVWYGYDTIFTLVNVIFVYNLSRNYTGNKSKPYRYISCVSCNTLWIFFIHGILVSLFKRYGVKEYPLANNFVANALLAYIILNISLSIAIVLKKIPILKLLVS